MKSATGWLAISALLAGLACACSDDDSDAEGDGARQDDGAGGDDGTAGADGSSTDDGAGGAGGAGPAEPDEQQIEIFSWWTSGGEIDALTALIDVFNDEYPDVEVVNLSTVEGHGDDAREYLAERMADNDPPDTFQLGPRDYGVWVEYEGDADDNRLEPLDSLFEEEGWDEAFPQPVLDVLTYSGSIYSVPVNMHRQNALFYNTSLVSDPPTTLEEFFTLAEELEDAGIVPLAVGAGTGGWTLEIVFYSVLAGSAGIDYFQDFFTGAADLSDADQLTALQTAIADYQRVIGFTNDDAGEDGFGWDAAAELVYDGTAAMYVHGDWAKGYFTSQGWDPGTDFGVVAALGSEGAFIYNVDTFALCDGAPNRENALNFLRVVGSPEAQAAFNILKGSTPVHAGVDSSDWDDVATATLDDYNDATVLHNVEIHQFSVTDDEGESLGLSDQLLALYQGDLSEEELVTWITDVYQDATTE